QTDFIPFTINSKNNKIFKMIADISETTKRIPPLPTSVTHQHTCKKYQQLINCEVFYDQYQLANDLIFWSGEAYHYSCLSSEAPTTLTSTSSLATASIFFPDYSTTRKNLTKIF